MSNMWFFVNIDTLGISENSKILSIGALAVQEGSMDSYDNLFKNSFNVVLNLKEQAIRGMERDTCEYWANKKGNSYVLNKDNWEHLKFAYHMLYGYLIKNGFNKESPIFSRGFNDSIWWRSLCETTIKEDNYMPFYQWRDVRTILDLLTGSTKVETTPYDVYYSSRDCVDDYIAIRNAMNNF